MVKDFCKNPVDAGFSDERSRAVTEPSETGVGDGDGTLGSCLQGCLALVVILLALIGFYMFAVWALGLFPHPELMARHHVAGGAATILVAATVEVMGESLIEDVIKFAIFTIGTPAVWHASGPGLSVIYLGVVVGVSVPLVLRAAARIF